MGETGETVPSGPLAAFLRERRGEILARWAAAARRLAPARERAGPALLDDLPDLLEGVAVALEGGAADRELAAADRHALARLDEGVDLSLVIDELALLRRAILELWPDGPGDPALLQLHGALDLALREVASRFARARARTLEALDRLATAAVHRGELDQVLRALCKVTLETHGAADTAVILLREGDLLRVRASIGLEEDVASGLTLAIGEGFGGRIAATRAPAELRDAARDPEIRSATVRARGVRALYGVPLLDGERLVGVTQIGSRSAYEFSRSDKLVFRSMAQRAASAIVQAQLRAALEREREALRATEARLRLGLAALQAVVFEQDEQLRYRWIHNPQLGLVPADFLGHTDEELFRVGEVGRLVALKREVLRGATPAPVELEVGVSGHPRTFEVHLAPIRRDGRVVGVLGAGRDVTEHKRQEASARFLAEAGRILAESLEYERTLARVAQLAVAEIADFCSVHLGEAPGALRTVAIAHKEREKVQLAWELERRWPANADDRHGATTAVRSGRTALVPELTEAMLATVEPAERRELVRRLGLVSILAVPLRTRGRTLGALTLSSAESGRRLGPQDLALAEELAALAALAVDNAILYEETRRALRAREDFLGIASHELKSPLAALHLQLQLLRRKVPQLPLERLDAGLARAEQQANRLAAMISELLDVSRLAAGRLVLDKEDLDLVELVHTVLGQLGVEAALSGSQVDLVAPRPVRGRWDRLRLEQIVTNLLSNALKYGDGKPVRVAVDADAERAQLSVEDQGIGIEPAFLEKLFLPFERAAGARAHQGTGLGLYIVRQLVEAHGGSIRASSAPGHGARFVVSLPRR